MSSRWPPRSAHSWWRLSSPVTECAAAAAAAAALPLASQTIAQRVQGSAVGYRARRHAAAAELSSFRAGLPAVFAAFRDRLLFPEPDAAERDGLKQMAELERSAGYCEIRTREPVVPTLLSDAVSSASSMASTWGHMGAHGTWEHMGAHGTWGHMYRGGQSLLARAEGSRRSCDPEKGQRWARAPAARALHQPELSAPATKLPAPQQLLSQPQATQPRSQPQQTAGGVKSRAGGAREGAQGLDIKLAFTELANKVDDAAMKTTELARAVLTSRGVECASTRCAASHANSHARQGRRHFEQRVYIGRDRP